MVSKRTLDEYFMHRALSLARRGLGFVRPNPMVGCVIVRDETIISEGWHSRYGQAHAEVAALEPLRLSGNDAIGATAYVTLEPCCHFGKTPPCAPRLVQEGIARVVVGMTDPNPRVDNGGIRILESAGVDVQVGILEDECRRLNRGFIWRHMLGRPWVTIKSAMTLDGDVACLDGSSKWITGYRARRMSHLLRAEHDGVLVGIGTIRQDDPSLNVRDTDGVSPVKIILDSNLSISENANVFRGGNVIIVCSIAASEEKKKELQRKGCDIVTVPNGPDGKLALKEMLRVLSEKGVSSVLVEGGPNVTASFLGAGLVDGFSLFVAPKILGVGRCFTGPLAIHCLDKAVSVGEMSCRSVGDDLWIEARAACSPDLLKPSALLGA